VVLAGLWLAPTSLAADLDTLLRDFRATPTGLKPAHAFSLKTLDGKTVTLADQRGRPVLLYFWATW
jgi:cytochrome oxidase Cu insertion factor (SCO1/SenC/PrrC family)